jgi:hypothetical protein
MEIDLRTAALLVSVVTGPIALILSIINTRLAYRRDRRSLRVVVTPGVWADGGIHSGDDRNTPILAQGPAIVVLKAVNTGGQPITLTMHGFVMPSGQMVSYSPSPKETQYPHELKAGYDILRYVGVDQLTADLRNNGCSGTTKIRGMFRDALGKKHKAKAYTIEV